MELISTVTGLKDSPDGLNRKSEQAEESNQ